MFARGVAAGKVGHVLTAIAMPTFTPRKKKRDRVPEPVYFCGGTAGSEVVGGVVGLGGVVGGGVVESLK